MSHPTYWWTVPAPGTGRERTDYYICPTRPAAESLRNAMRGEPIKSTRIFERAVKVDRAALVVWVLAVRRPPVEG